MRSERPPGPRTGPGRGASRRLGARRRPSRRVPRRTAGDQRPSTSRPTTNRAPASTGSRSATRASRPWPRPCARSPTTPIHSSRSSTRACDRTDCASNASACRSASSAWSTRTDRTSRVTWPGSACEAATPPTFADRPRPSPPISSSCRSGARPSRRRASRRPASRWCRTPRTRPRPRSCRLSDVLDCLIPRGGPSLIKAMREHARVPYVLDGDGNCHVFVDESADLVERGRHRAKRQDLATGGLQRRRDGAGARRTSRPSSCRRCRRLCPKWSCARRRRAPVPAERHAGDRRGLRTRVPRPDPRGQGRGITRRGHRARRALRHRPQRGDPHRRTAPTPTRGCGASTPRPSS